MDIISMGGVWAVSPTDGGLVYLLSGYAEDKWRIIGCYHKDWIDGIIATLRRV